MSEAHKFDDNHSHPNAGPDLTPVANSPEGAFFELLPINEIDLEPIRHDPRAQKGEEAIRFITEAAEGPISDAKFRALFNKSAAKIMENKLSADDLTDIYDILEIKKPRVIALLTRIRLEQMYTPEHFVALNKVCLLFSANRHIDEQKK